MTTLFGASKDYGEKVTSSTSHPAPKIVRVVFSEITSLQIIAINLLTGILYNG